jgi:hypothetical protein
MFDEKTGLVEFPVSIETWNDQRIRFHDDVLCFVSEQLVRNAGNHAQARAKLQNGIVRTHQILDQFAFLFLVGVAQKTRAVAQARQVSRNGELASICSVIASSQIKDQTRKLLQDSLIERAEPRSKNFANRSRKVLSSQ